MLYLNADSPQHHLLCPDIRVHLKPHQLASIHQCLRLEKCRIPLSELPLLDQEYNVPRRTMNDGTNYIDTTIGIIGDKVGAGKSYIVLGIISESKLIPRDGHHRVGNLIYRSYGFNSINLSLEYQLRSVNTTILVVPYNLVPQWTQYIATFNGGLSYIVISRKKHFADLDKEVLYSKDVVLVSSSFLNQVATKYFTGIHVRRIVYDEADNITSSIQHSISTAFTWFVTATFQNLTNPHGFAFRSADGYIRRSQGIRSSGYIKNLFISLLSARGTLLESLVVTNDDRFVDQSYSLEPPVSHVIECHTPIEVHLLNGIVDQRIVAYLNAHDVESAINVLASSQRGSESNIVHLMVERLERHLHNLTLQMTTFDSQLFESEEEKEAKRKTLMDKLESVREKVANINKRITETNNCCICYSDIVNRTVTVCCSNVFCFECIHRWISRSPVCPLCKAALSSGNLLVVTQPEPEPEPEPEIQAARLQSMALTQGEAEAQGPNTSNEKTKVENMIEIIRYKVANNLPMKLLIFSEHDNSFRGIMPELDSLGVTFKCLKGNSAQISCTISKYKTSNLDVLLVNSSFYGTGLNLENTTDIIVFHKTAIEVERQIIGRAQRCGRTSVLNVWYLYHANEIVPTSR